MSTVTAPGLGVASARAQTAAREIEAGSGRRVDIPMRRSFVRSDDCAALPPMVSVYRGGRGGDVAIRLYVALIWRSARSPYDSSETATAWATLLDLDDPGDRGADRVRAAMRKLEQFKLVSRENRPGRPTRVVLRREDGSGRAYDIPSTAYTLSRGKRRDAHRYFKIPAKLWTDGVFQDLSGPALVMLLIFLSERGAEGKEVWFSTAAFRDRYGISSRTRADGAKELVQRGLLSERSEKLGGFSGGTNQIFTNSVQRRKVYTLHGSARL